MLSAQTTDKKVNEATKILFKKYQTIDELAKADIFLIAPATAKTIRKSYTVF